jgi:hypothetical protein
MVISKYFIFEISIILFYFFETKKTSGSAMPHQYSRAPAVGGDGSALSGT